MSTIFISLPFPPSVNTYWRLGQLKHMKRPMHMISQKGRDYTNMVKRIVMLNKLKESFMNGEELHVSIKLIPPDRRQRDIDNYTKGIFDSLSKANFWGDDSQVKVLTIEIQEPKKPGFAQLEITQREVNHETKP